MPARPTFAPDMTSRITYGGRKPQQKKTAENAASRQLQAEFLEKVYARITKFHMVVGDNCPHTSAGYETSLVTSGRLQNAITYWTKVMHKRVRPAKSKIIRPLFNPGEQNVAGTSMPT